MQRILENQIPFYNSNNYLFHLSNLDHTFKEMAESQWLQQAKNDILPEFHKIICSNILMQNYKQFYKRVC